jgi:hypothetical protein
MFVIPAQKGNWTWILNKDANQEGTSSYKKELDVVRVEVKPEAIPLRERLSYQFLGFTGDQGMLALEWEKVRLPVLFKVGTDAQVTTNIQKMVDNAWMPYNSAARYELEQKKDFDLGLKYVEMSLQHAETWRNVWTKAQLLAEKGNYKEAYPLAQKAQQMGEKGPGFYAAEDVKKALKDWKSKS